MENPNFEYIHYAFIALIGLLVLYSKRKTILSLVSRGSVMKGADIQARIHSLLDPEKQRELYNVLNPILERTENYRRNKEKVFWALAVTMIITIVFYTLYAVPYILSMKGDDNGNTVLFGYFVQLAIPYIPVWLYKKHFKKNVTPLVAEKIDYVFDPNGGTTWKALAEKEGSAQKTGILTTNFSALFGHFNRVKTEDHFHGKYRNRDISFEELEIIRGSGKHRKTIFKGLLMVVNAPKKADVPVVLRRDISGILGGLLKDNVSNMEVVTLEDPQFEKEFDVYSTDQIKSRTILTPRFMERLKGISEFYGGRPVMAAFYDEKVFIAVQLGGDLFEPASFFTDARSKRNIELILAQIELQHQVVDSLQ